MITRQFFDRLFPTKGLNPAKYNLVRDRGKLIDALNRILPKYAIDNYMRICAFFANCGIETDYFKTTIEYASGDAYEGRKDLGNTHPGDGRRFKGRGLSQTTGRSNYAALQEAIGDKLGIDVVANPALLAQIDIAVESACVFWQDHDLNDYADRGAFKQLSGIVNRGDEDLTPLQWPKRNELYSKCRRYIPKDFSFSDLSANKEVQQPQGFVSIPKPEEPLQSNENPPVETPEIDGSFIADAFDKNVSTDQIKEASRTAGQRAWQFAIRPLMLLYGALEAGNVAAWLGVVVLIAIVGLMLYWHRADIQKLIEKLKGKFTQ
jgi:predicted chitinase